MLRKLTTDPERPYVVILGGSKVSDKLGVITSLLPTTDRILIGGGMAYTFLAAQGYGVGDSLLQADQIDTVTKLLAENGDKIVLPSRLRHRRRLRRGRDDRDRRRRRHPRRLDGSGHRSGFAAPRSPTSSTDAKTIFWNGPVGVFEMDGLRERHQGGGRGHRRERRVLRGRRR